VGWHANCIAIASWCATMATHTMFAMRGRSDLGGSFGYRSEGVNGGMCGLRTNVSLQVARRSHVDPKSVHK
jgi:hypothetical protein